MNAMPNFYVTGGTLSNDALSYVPRQADLDLYDGLRDGRFCYVLTSRQMGKSSLMVRVAHRLRGEGTTVLILDLTRVGQNVTPEQWYDGLQIQMARQLDVEDQMEQFWADQQRLGPLQRFMSALETVVLPRCPGQVVIFVDEIDAVRSPHLKFSTDEFFAAIRECYNRRSDQRELGRLTFCLLGVARPSDLIQDTRTTPFNIGRRIELADFSEKEALPLTRGLGCDEPSARALLGRILYWTGGHPFLTQKLCQAVSAVANQGQAGVDQACERLFLSNHARERDDNLLFVRDRLLRTILDKAGLLDLYRKVHAGRSVLDDETNPLISELRLSGITRVQSGGLAVRNRIYRHVFDRQWVQANMPDAEKRRQKAAYRKGLLRAGLVVTAIALVVGGLAFYGWSQNLALRLANDAIRGQEVALQEKDDALKGQEAALKENAQLALQLTVEKGTRLLHEGDWAGGLICFVDALHRDKVDAGRRRLHGIRVASMLGQCPHLAYVWFHGSGKVTHAAFSRDERRIVTVQDDKLAQVFELANDQPLCRIPRSESILSVEFHPDGQKLLLATVRAVELWDSQGRTDKPLLTMETKGIIQLAALSPRGDRILIVTRNQGARICSVKTGEILADLDDATIQHAAFSPDGQQVVTASSTGAAQIWDAESGEKVDSAFRDRDRENPPMHWAFFSPDAKHLATADGQTIRVWRVADRKKVSDFSGHNGFIRQVQFSPSGQFLLTASDDQTARLWDFLKEGDTSDRVTPTRNSPQVIEHAGIVYRAVFSPDGRWLATASSDHTVRVGLPGMVNKPGIKDPSTPLLRHGGPVNQAVFSHAGRWLLTASDDGAARLWDMTSSGVTHSSLPTAVQAELSPDGRLLALVGTDQTVILCEARTGKVLRPLPFAEPVALLRFSPDGRRLLVGGTRGLHELWEVAQAGQGSRQVRVGAVAGAATRVAWSGDGNTLALFWQGRPAQVWKADHEDLIELTAGQKSLDAALSHRGRWLVTAEGSARNVPGTTFATAGLIDLTAGTASLTGRLEQRGEAHYYRFVANVNGAAVIRQLAAPGSNLDSQLLVYDAEQKLLAEDDDSGKGLDSQVEISLTAGRAYNIRTTGHGSSVGGYLLTIAVNGAEASPPAPDKVRIQLVDLVTLKARTLAETDSHRASFAFSTDDRLVFLENRQARIWDTQTDQWTVTLSHTHDLRWGRFSRQGHYLITDSSNDTAQLWDSRSGARLATLNHRLPVRQAVFSNDERLVATASVDGAAQVWSVRTGEAVTPMPMCPSYDQSQIMVLAPGMLGRDIQLAFHPDGDRLFTLSGRSVQCWDLHASRLGQLEDVRTLVEVLSGNHAQMQDGLIMPLSADQFRNCWRKVQAGHRERLRQALGEMPNWHWQQAELHRQARNWQGALRHLECLDHDQAPTTWLVRQAELHRELGKSHGTLDHFDRARACYARASNAKDAPDLRWDQAALEREAGDSLLEKASREPTAYHLIFISKAYAACAAVLPPGNERRTAEARGALAVSYRKFAEVLLRARCYQAAENSIQHWLALLPDRSPGTGFDIAGKQSLASRLKDLGELPYSQLQRIRSIYQLVLDLPGPLPGSDRYHLFNGLGQVCRDLKDRRVAESCFIQAALAAHEWWGQDSTSEDARRNLTAALLVAGDVLLELDDFPGAESHYQQALDLDRAWLAQEPGSSMARDRLLDSLDKLGQLRVRQGNRTAAAQIYREYQLWCEGLTAPGSTARIDAYEKLGRVYRQSLVEPAAAYRFWKMVRDYEQAEKRSTDEARLNLADAYEWLGDCCLELGHALQGLADCRQCLELKMLLANTAGFHAVCWSPDGSRLATAGQDATVRLWDPRTGKPLLVCRGHTDWVRGVAFSRDGSRLASGGSDHTIKIWDAQDGKELQTLRGHTGDVMAIAFHPNGTLLASGSDDKQVRLWNLTAPPEQRVLVQIGCLLRDHTILALAAATERRPLVHGDNVTCVAWSPDGKLLASGGHDHRIRIWDPASGNEIMVLSGHTDWVRGLCFSSDGKLLASASDDKRVGLFEMPDGQLQRFLIGHTDYVHGVGFSSDGKLLVSGGDDDTVRLWNPATGEELNRFRPHGNKDVRSVAITADGKLIASAAEDKVVRVLRIGSEQLVTIQNDVVAPRYRRRVGYAYLWLSNTAWAAGEAAEARQALDAAFRLWQDQLNEQQDNPNRIDEVADAEWFRGRLAWRMGDGPRAQEYYEAALKLRQLLAERDPTGPDALAQLASVHRRLGDIDLAMGQTDSAREHFEKSRCIVEPLYESLPNVPSRQDALVATLSGLASVDLRLEKFPEAASLCERALKIKEDQDVRRMLTICKEGALILQDPELVRKQATPERLTQLLGFRATALARKGQWADAEAAAEMLRQLKPQDSEHAYVVASCYATLAREVIKGRGDQPLPKDEETMRAKFMTRAIQALREALKPDSKLWINMLADDNFDPLRSEKAYRDLIAQGKPPPLPE